MKKFEKITAIIPLLESENRHGKWIVDTESKGTPEDPMFVSSSGFQLRQRFFSHVARKGFRFGKGVPLSLFGFAS